jgi:hypothetical protein
MNKKTIKIIKSITLSSITVLISVLTVFFVVKAATSLTLPGSALSNGAPVATMHTLEDVYQALATGATASTHNLTPASGPTTGTMHTLDDVYSKVPAANQVCSGTNGGTATCGGGTPTLVWQTDQNQNLFQYNAITYCANLDADGVTSDATTQNIWRLPSYTELTQAFTNTYIQGGSGNPGGFRGAVHYWSSTLGSSGAFWVYGFRQAILSGETFTGAPEGVRCVRTALTWQADQSQTLNWNDATSYCANLDADGVTADTTAQNIWRLPSEMELTNAFIDTYYQGGSGYPGGFASGAHYWSGTTIDGYEIAYMAGDDTDTVGGSIWASAGGEGENQESVRCVK